MIATQDHKTILSVLENLKLRIGADAAMLISLDQQLRADTARPDATGTFSFLDLVEKAQQAGRADAIGLFEETSYCG